MIRYKQISISLLFLSLSLHVFAQQSAQTGDKAQARNKPQAENAQAENARTPENAFAGYPHLEKTFRHPGDEVQTSIYWYWMSGNISKEGVVKDLESMKKAGINRAFIGNIDLPETAPGKIKFLSEDWWDILHTALRTATRLNIEIGIFNSPGWSQSGGPWIRPEQSMRYLACSETNVVGGQRIVTTLKKPNEKFQDVRTIAFPVPKDYFTGISSTEINIPLDSVITIDIQNEKELPARSLLLYPSPRPIIAGIKFQVSSADTFRTIKEFTIDRSNSALNVGFSPYGPVAISLPATNAKNFRIVISNYKSNYARSWGPRPDSTSGIRELKILSSPKVEYYIEKTLAKMSQTPFPLWGQYLWPDQPGTTHPPTAQPGTDQPPTAQPATANKALYIDPAAVIDISQFMAADGTLDWNAPAGQWVIVRSGMVPTGVVNSPAPPNGTGLEVDKMNKDYLTTHFDGYIGQILSRIPAEDRKTFRIVVEDSYETGGQNWTDGLPEKFKAVYGYDPTPYIPVLYGSVVGSEDMSNRFLWDLRRFIADKVSFEYVGGLRDISHKYGLTTWLENYGHWGFPGEFLQYGGQSDEIGGEFWSEGDLGNIENRAASSSAHIYGKTKVSAESFTCGGAAFSRYPAKMKQRGDRFFTEGINNTLLHVCIEQPYPDKLPGVNAGFGNEFNRNNTWFNDMPLFTDYIKRCNLLLQQGRYVADVAYFIGEDAPKMTGVCDPILPKGYSFDYINADVLKERVRVVDGKLTLPNGISYSILVLPKLTTIRPELLSKIRELVQNGAVVMGPKPERSPGLQGYPKSDEQVISMAGELWGHIDGRAVRTNRYGKGLVIDGMSLQEALDRIKANPDCTITGDDSVLFIHRKIDADDLYFISNQKNKPVSFDASFHVTGKKPELWDAVTGTSRLLPVYQTGNAATTIPLMLDANGSAFIVFRTKDTATARSGKHNDGSNSATNFPEQKVIAEINTPWQVKFDTAMRGPEKPITFNKLTDWAKNDNEKIKHYSGTAIYHNSFTITSLKKDQHILIDLGALSAMARITINGKEIGGVWTAPYQLDITDAIKKGNNTMEIAVVNTWVNRLVGDLALPEKDRRTWVNVNPYNATSPLEVSGLLGPVTIRSVNAFP
jgi:hypothetical protein